MVWWGCSSTVPYSIKNIYKPTRDAFRLIPEGAVDAKYIEESADTPDTGSFMHLHLGIDAKGLRDLDIHYSVSPGDDVV